MQMLKRKSGITLVALIITIIILLILAGVSLSFVFNWGILDKSQQAVNEYENAANTENKLLDDINSYLENKLNEIGAGSSEDNEEPVLATIVSELKDGNYVRYIDKNNIERDCVVLYDANSNYGVQIITMDTVEDVDLGNGTENIQWENETYFNKVVDNYNNAINILNTRAYEYKNDNYSDDARCVGSAPNNKNSESNEYFSSDLYEYMIKYNGKFKRTTNNHIVDYNKMVSLDIVNIKEDYWLASRYVDWREEESSIGIQNIGEDGNLFGYNLCFFTPETYNANIGVRGLRPVFYLKNEIKIIDGDGSKNNPYILEKF